jgi:4-hydroxythreonine-4-phosphate dehydrogenase
MGDPGGIGAEIVAKALSHPSLKRIDCRVFGDRVLFNKYGLKETPRRQLIDGGHFKTTGEIKRSVSKTNGLAALDYLRQAVAMIKKGDIDALVTAPVCKEAIAMTEKNFVGHTEWLAGQFNCRSVEMMFVCADMRVAIATRHIPLKRVPGAITRQRLTECIERTHRFLQRDFKIRSPRIAVCGLNPHAGEGGTIGNEEKRVIIPALNSLAKKGLNLAGPVSADTVFIKANRRHFDAIVALYHDQGLIAAKTLYFDTLVNLTIGLPFARTSPDHGTAFDIAGRGKADASSMTEAIKLAHRLA